MRKNVRDLKISVIIPLFNEGHSFEVLIGRLLTIAKEESLRLEILLIDDGSTDNTGEVIDALVEKYPCVIGIHFSRNFGHQEAISAGLKHVTGEIVFVMDGDGQDPPEYLPTFISKWQEGYDIILGVRKSRGGSLIKALIYKLYYRFLRFMVGIEVPVDSGDFSLLDRKVVECINSCPETNRFIRGLRAWSGFRTIGIPLDRPQRIAGKPKYSLKKLFRLGFNGLFAFSIVPLRIISFTGLTIMLCSLIFAAFLIYIKIAEISFMGGTPGEVPGYTSLMVCIIFLSSMNLLALGIMGEYMGRMYLEAKRRPEFVIAYIKQNTKVK